MLPLINDAKGLKQQIKSLAGACNFVGLVKMIKSLLNPNGKALLMKNYILHVRAINKQLVTVHECDKKFYNCGQSAGTIFRIMTGWSLTKSLVSYEYSPCSCNNIMDLVDGIAHTINWNTPSYYADIHNKISSYKE